MIMFIDTETTGIEEKDRVIQIGGNLIPNNWDVGLFECKKYSQLTKLLVPISLDAMVVHGLTEEMFTGVDTLTSETEFFIDLQTHSKPENYLIGHNVKYDIDMLVKDGFVNNYTVVDTLICAKHMYPDLPRHSLQYLRYHFKTYLTEKGFHNEELKAHDALSDVIILQALFARMLVDVPDTAEDKMVFMVELTKEPVVLKYMPFGKFKGMEIMKLDISYLLWAVSNLDAADVVYSCKNALRVLQGVK